MKTWVMASLLIGGAHLACAFTDRDGDSYSDAAETAFGTNPGLAESRPDHALVVPKPNLVVIYADDMGFGDMSAYGAFYGTSSVPTPHMDSVASNGVMFTQAHSSNGVCTPSRNALLLGKYNWREGGTSNISGHYGESDLPRSSDTTLAEFLKAQGYDTAAFGKWHLGGSWYYQSGAGGGRVDGNPETESEIATIDWGRPVEGHAIANGFDYYRGLCTSINFAPYVFMKNDRMQYFIGQSGEETDPSKYRDALATDHFDYLTADILGEGMTTGLDSRDGAGDPSYRQMNAGPLMINHFEEFMADRSSSGDTDPLFAYVSLYSPHKPWAITPPFQDSIGFEYGDFITEVDHRIGRVLATLGDPNDPNSLAANTIVVLTSDNGPDVNATWRTIQNGYDANGPLCGNKNNIHEGGTRVPFAVRWPGQAAPGLVLNDLIWQGDIFATIAAVLSVELTDDVAPDGESFLNLIRGQQKPLLRREAVVFSAGGHRALATTDGWKFIKGSGDNTDFWDSSNIKQTAFGAADAFPMQLYNLDSDLGENSNLISASATETEVSTALVSQTGEDLLGLLDQLLGSFTTAVYPRESDTDADGLSNLFENSHSNLNPNVPGEQWLDFESDGLSNFLEYIHGGNPNVSDTDGDRLKDGLEVHAYGSAVNNAHSDADTLEDGDEVLIYATSPVLADTDGDGVDDDDELALFSNPRNADVMPGSGGGSGVQDAPVTDPSFETGKNTTDYLFTNNPNNIPVTAGELNQWISREAGVTATKFETVDIGLDNAGGYTAVTGQTGNKAALLRSKDPRGMALVMAVNVLSGDTVEFVGDFALVGAAANVDGNVQVVGFNDFTGLTCDLGGNWKFTGGTYDVLIDSAVSKAAYGGTSFLEFSTSATAAADYAYLGLIIGGDGGVDNSVTDFVAFDNLQLTVGTVVATASLDSDGDQLLDDWEITVFGSLTNVTGMGDADADGVINLLEQALGSDADNPAQQPAFGFGVSPLQGIDFQYLRHRVAGLGYELQVSENLVDWHPWPDFFDEIAVTDLGNDYERVDLRTQSQPAPEKLFARLAVHVLGGSN